MDEININGPVNIVRLEGHINNGENKIKKIIYLFGDVHLPLGLDQNHCIQDHRIDIDVFLSKIFTKNPNINYDLFIESPKENLIRECDITTKNYILNMRDFVNKNFNLDDKNNVIRSDKYPNVRFHYFDLRNSFNKMFKVLDRLTNYIHSSLDWRYDLRRNVDILLNDLTILRTRIDEIVTILDSNNIKEIKKIRDIKRYKYEEIYESIIDKYNQIEKKLKSIDVQNLKFDIVKRFNKHIKSSKINNYDYVFDIFQMIYKISKDIEDETSKLIDLYLIRRFLDKDYINIGIVYAGYAHFSHILHILINDFKFVITHSTTDMQDKTKIISYAKSKTAAEFVSYLLNEISINLYVIQCSQYTNFPKNLN